MARRTGGIEKVFRTLQADCVRDYLPVETSECSHDARRLPGSFEGAIRKCAAVRKTNLIGLN